MCGGRDKGVCVLVGWWVGEYGLGVSAAQDVVHKFSLRVLWDRQGHPHAMLWCLPREGSGHHVPHSLISPGRGHAERCRPPV